MSNTAARQPTEAEVMRAKGYVTADEAAAAARRHPTRIYAAVRAGRLIGSHSGDRLYVRWTSLIDWVNRRDTNAASLLGMGASPPPLPREKAK